MDVTDLDSIAELPKAFPDVTLLVNNAGYFSGNSFVDKIQHEHQEILINYIAPIAIVQSYASTFAKVEKVAEDTKPTAVVNVASIASYVNFPLGGTYSASKAALHSLTAAQRRDLKNSLVIGVYPGPIDTDMARDIPMEKTTPSTVAQAVMDALKTGTEEVFPDPMAVYLYEGWKADANATQQAAESVSA